MTKNQKPSFFTFYFNNNTKIGRSISKIIFTLAIVMTIAQFGKSTKDQEMENMITTYLHEKIKTQDGLEINHALPVLSFEQEKARQFKMIDYLFKQPEMEKVISLTPEERQCFELKRFVASVPFNNDLLDTSKILQKTRDQFEGISFRSLVYKFLLDDAFRGTENYTLAVQNYHSLIDMKQKLIDTLNEQEMNKMTIVNGKWDKTLEKGQEEMDKLEKSKYYNLTQFSNVQNNIIGIQENIQSISDKILQDYSQSNNLVNMYRQGEDFLDAVSVATESEMIVTAKFVTETYNNNRDLINATLKLVNFIKEHNIFEKMNKWLVLQKYDNDKESLALRKQLKSQMSKTKSKVAEARKELTVLIEKIMKELKESVYDIPEYKNMLSLMKEYKVQLKILYGYYEKIIGVNRELDKLSYIMFNQEETNNRALLDAYIAPENEIVLQNQIDRITEKNSELKDFVYQIKGLQRVDKDNQIYDKILNWKGFTEDEQEELARLKTIKFYIEQIVMKEKNVDKLLAEAMGKTRSFVMESSMDSRNQTCLDDLELGHTIMNMAKYYMIIDLDNFLKIYMSGWHILDVRKFVLLNYAVFTSEEYQGRMIEDYPIQKVPPMQQEATKTLIIRDYSLRLNFFVGMFRQRQVEIDSMNRNSFFSKQGLFFRNLIFNICNYFRNVKPGQVVKFLVEVVSIILAKLIPFSSLFKGLFVILRSLISLLLGQLIRLVVRMFKEYKLQIYAFWMKATRMIREKLGSRVLQDVNSTVFFQRNASFMNYGTQCWKYDNCFESTVHDETREELPNKKTYNFSSLRSVDDRYREILQMTRKSRRKNSDFNYLRKITQFKGGNYVMKKDQLMNNQDLLVTSLLYYRSQMALNIDQEHQEVVGQLYI